MTTKIIYFTVGCNEVATECLGQLCMNARLRLRGFRTKAKGATLRDLSETSV